MVGILAEPVMGVERGGRSADDDRAWHEPLEAGGGGQDGVPWWERGLRHMASGRRGASLWLRMASQDE